MPIPEICLHHGDGGGGEKKEGSYRDPQVVAVVRQVIELGREWANQRIGKARGYWSPEENAQLRRLIFSPPGAEPSQTTESITFLWETAGSQKPTSLRLTDKELAIDRCSTFEIDVTEGSVQVTPLEWGRPQKDRGERVFLKGSDREEAIKRLHRFFQLDGFRVELQKQTEENVWHNLRGPEEIAGTLLDWAVDALYQRRSKLASSLDRGRYRAALKRWLPDISVVWDGESWGESMLIAWSGQETTISPRFKQEKGIRERRLSLGGGLELVLSDDRGRFDIEGLRRELGKGWVVDYRLLEHGGLAFELSNKEDGGALILIREMEGGAYLLSSSHKLFQGHLMIECSRGRVILDTGALKVKPDVEDLGDLAMVSFREQLELPWTEIEIDSCQGPLELSIRSGHQIFQDETNGRGNENKISEIKVVLPSEGFPLQSELLEKAIFRPGELSALGTINIA